ncbi:MAG: DUF1573 domain-containing protein [Verrucomicrobiales bacterium]
MRLTFLLWASLAPLLPAAGLTFPETVKEINAPADATFITMDFPFANKSDKSVVIKRYDAGCSCVSAGVESGKLIYQPGESGVIRTQFNMSEFSGDVEKPVYVFLEGDTDQVPSVVLTLKVHIPEVVKIATKTLKWEVGAPPTPQTIRMTVEGDDKVNIVAVTGSNSNFLHELKVLEAGRSYELIVTPKDTSVSGLGVFRIETDCKIERHKFKQTFASIRRPLPSEAPPAKP